MLLDSAHLRENYDVGTLDEADADSCPLRQFTRWFAEAEKAGVHEPNAMTLATVGADGQPSARMVLLKGVDDGGFQFFTNYESRKGKELENAPRAALLFWWAPLQRQVRIEGKVERLSAAESDAYFASRPLGSRIGAAASPQSSVIEDREWLARRVAELEAAGEPARPANWGGYRVRPHAIEFWQGRPSRLHDRLRYERAAEGDAWSMARLAP